MIEEYLTTVMGISRETVELFKKAERDVEDRIKDADDTAFYNQAKVLRAMQGNQLSDGHFHGTNGYGYHDHGRDALEAVYADVFRAEAALVRPQMVSGTHALTVALFGILRPGDELLSPVGKPYDTLDGVIGIRKTDGSLADYGISYQQADLLPDGCIDYGNIERLMCKKTKMAIIQRSKGYSWRHSLTVREIEELIGFIKSIDKNVICLLDNCYGEFVEASEPTADLIVGSLIKNPGGGMAPSGGYIAGKYSYVEMAAQRLTAPGLGREVGPTLGLTSLLAQGLFIAPQVVAGSVKGAVLTSRMFQLLGYDVLPKPQEKRGCIVQAIRFGNEERLLAYCRGVQRAAPVDSFAVLEASDMPGYDAPVVMAAGNFVQGASIELSADAPVKPPYIAYVQGGLTWHHARLGAMLAADPFVRGIQYGKKRV